MKTEEPSPINYEAAVVVKTNIYFAKLLKVPATENYKIAQDE